MSKQLADWLSVLMIAATVIVAIVIYPALPDPMPSHFNAAGEPDAYMAKLPNVLLLLSTPVFMLLLMKVIPVISPKGFRTEGFSATISVLQLVMVAFGCIVAIVVFLKARGMQIDLVTIITAATGLLFVVIGNYMGKFRKNFFIGIRTPWTLASDEVWVRTHRLGGWLMLAAGLFMIVGAFAGIGPTWMVAAVLAAALFPALYSFLLYRRIEGFDADSEDETAG